MHRAATADSGWDRHARSGWLSRSEWHALTHHELAPRRIPGASPSRRRGPRARLRQQVLRVVEEILRRMVQVSTLPRPSVYHSDLGFAYVVILDISTVDSQ